MGPGVQGVDPGAAAQEGGTAGAAVQQAASGRAFWKRVSRRRRLLFSAPLGGPRQQLRLASKHLRAARGESKRRSLMQWLHFKPGFLRRLSKRLGKRD